jgi:UDP-3-O-[3-hydroxymyristoyl] glucosamine N-acyltransferase
VTRPDTTILPVHPGLPPTTGDTAAMLNAELVGAADIPLRRLDTLHEAGEGSVTFIRSKEYAAIWPESDASAVIVSRGVDLPEHPDQARAILWVPDADRAVFALLTLVSAELDPATETPGVHHSAFVHETATVDPSVHVGPGCRIDAGSVIEPGVVLESGVTIATRCRIGARSRLRAGVTLYDHVSIGQDVLLHAHVVIGADGFGFDRDPDTGVPLHIPHVGGVRIGDRVEIGANSCVDRGKFADTIVGDDTKIDNLVQIGHGCHVGVCVVVCAGCAIGGSTVLGDYATLGGGCRLADNITVEPGSQIAGASAVSGNVLAAEPVIGYPARPRSVWFNERRRLRAAARLSEQFDGFIERLASLEARLGDGPASPGTDPDA